jgi:hypothetical protein
MFCIINKIFWDPIYPANYKAAPFCPTSGAAKKSG